MTLKVNGAAYTGRWFERNTAFVKVTFSGDITAVAAGDLSTLDGTAAGAGTVADASFGVIESAMVQALKHIGTRATILGISKYDAGSDSVDVIVGHAEGWFSDNVGVIATGLPVVAAKAKVTTAGAAPTDTVGEIVSVNDGAFTFDLSFAAFDGTLPVATEANGDLATGPGSSSGATPPNSPTGTPGYYPDPA